MFCQQCGKELPEGAQECPSCGAKTGKAINFEDVKGYANQKGQEITQSVQNMAQDFKHQMQEEKEVRQIKDISNILVNPEERQIAVLGSGYLSNLIRNGQLAKGFGVLTDHRFYYRGKCFNRTEKMLYKTDEEKTVDLQDIMASGFVYNRNIFLAILALTATVCTVLLSIAEYADSYYNYDTFWFILLFGGAISIALWVLYLVYKRAIYQISFAGGMIAIKAATYGSKQLHNFDRQLRQAKDEKLKKAMR